MKAAIVLSAVLVDLKRGQALYARDEFHGMHLINVLQMDDSIVFDYDEDEEE